MRDLVWGIAPKDLDLVVPSGALEKARALADRLHGSYVPLDLERGIARVVLPGGLQLDIADRVGATLEDDLRNRDFTLNAMAYDRGLIDPTGGLEDARNRVLRPTHEGVFHDDPLRLLRAPRLMAACGLTLAPGVEASLRLEAPRLRSVAPERITDELFLTFRADLPSVLPLFRSTGLLDAIGAFDLDALERWCAARGRWSDWLEQPLTATHPRGFAVALAAAGIDPQSLVLARAEQKAIARIQEAVPQVPSVVTASRGEQHRFFKRYGAEAVDALLVSVALHGTAVEELLAARESLANPPVPLTGDDLVRELGLAPGPAIGRILEELAVQCAERGQLNREEALALARDLLAR